VLWIRFATFSVLPPSESYKTRAFIVFLLI
jgi:hypothetical protein